MRNDAMTFGRGALPRIRWGAIAAGVLCALAIQIVLGLLGLGLGFAADPADSQGLGVLAAIWGILVPLAASLAGAYVATRVAASLHPSSGYLHGVLVWCVGLVAGALFFAGVIGSTAIGTGAAMSRFLGRNDAQTQLNARDTEEASKRAAETSALAAVAALFGLGGALVGATAGRKAMLGDISELGYRRERTVEAGAASGVGTGAAVAGPSTPSRGIDSSERHGPRERGTTVPRTRAPGRGRGEEWRGEMNSPTRH